MIIVPQTKGSRNIKLMIYFSGSYRTPVELFYCAVYILIRFSMSVYKKTDFQFEMSYFKHCLHPYRSILPVKNYFGWKGV